MTLKQPLAGLTAAAAVALAAAACGGSSPAVAPAVSTPPASTPATSTATVDMASTNLGDILVDSSGRTLYLFKKDGQSGSACTGSCAVNWPPLTVSGTPSAGAGVNGAKLGTTVRTDGKTQVTYGGHPLYLFAGDAKTGDTKGEEVDAFGAEWYAVSPKGAEVEKTNAVGGY